MTLNVAVDIGGTFTDCIGYEEETARVVSSKSSTTPSDLTEGILRCFEKGGLDVDALDTFVHGSTIAINTVIERKGAPTALVVTSGTRDVYKIGRGNRPEAYNIFFKRPQPLVPRHLTFEIEERMLSSGEVLTEFDVQQAREVARAIAAEGVKAVAVCFLHSWANPTHEAEMGRILAEALPGCYISLSHEILREYGEYERTSTTVLNSYIGPRISGYVDDLEEVLKKRGFRGNLLIMQSNGGVMSPPTAKRVTVAMLESGPVGGFIAAARTGEALGYDNVIAFDMGGTTAKTNLIRDKVPQLAHGYYIGGYAAGQPMMLPVIDTIEVGSGGGSIGWVDEVGALKVGPRSAGAEPGPVCYGKGGQEPTITDANLVLGRLGAADFLGGEMPLDLNAAKAAIERNVASPLRVSVVEAAQAMLKIAIMNMSLAVRGISVERGYDPRDFVMVAFGGAGPLHAVEVARELHIPTVIVPNFPSQFSALGMLLADVQHDYVRTYYRKLGATDFKEVRAIADELTETGLQTLRDDAVAERAVAFQWFLDIRYAGQDFPIPVPIRLDFVLQADGNAIRQAFDALHERRYGYHSPDKEVEIVNVRLSAIGKRPQPKFPPIAAASTADALRGTRKVFVEGAAEPIAFNIYDRSRLAAGQRIAGPAVIQEYASTTMLFAGDSATVAGTGELTIQVGSYQDDR